MAYTSYSTLAADLPAPRRLAFHRPRPLPYDWGALEPFISAHTLQAHHGGHYAACIRRVNILSLGTRFENAGLERIVVQAPDGPLLEYASEAWSHEFFWSCLSPRTGLAPGWLLAEEIRWHFGSPAVLRDLFIEEARNLAGMGWIWLVQEAAGDLAVRTLGTYETPLRIGVTPLLACDLWQHAYYADYGTHRDAYIRAFWQRINWDVVGAGLALPDGAA
ncbi:MAG: Fe-Mn family superoxide dismutase [Gammaproteobacteria bacterium]